MSVSQQSPAPKVTGAEGAVGPTPQLSWSQDALYFPLPITEHNVENAVEVTNPDNVTVLFKVKTSAPDRYIVRPANGMVPPRSVGKIRFVLMASLAQHITETCRDRFTVEMRFASPSDHLTDLATCWKVPPVPPQAVIKVTLPCRFVRGQLPNGIVTSRAAEGSSSTSKASRPPLSTASSTVMHDGRRSESAQRLDVGEHSIERSLQSTARTARENASPSEDTLGGKLSLPSHHKPPSSPATPAASSSTHHPGPSEPTTPQLIPVAGNGATADRTADSQRMSMSSSSDLRTAKSTTSARLPTTSSFSTPPRTPLKQQHGKRVSGFNQVLLASLPLAAVLPLLALFFALGALSENTMAWVESAVGQVVGSGEEEVLRIPSRNIKPEDEVPARQQKQEEDPFFPVEEEEESMENDG